MTYGVFADAPNAVKEIQDFVTNQQEMMIEKANATRDAAKDSIAAIATGLLDGANTGSSPPDLRSFLNTGGGGSGRVGGGGAGSHTNLSGINFGGKGGSFSGTAPDMPAQPPVEPFQKDFTGLNIPSPPATPRAAAPIPVPQLAPLPIPTPKIGARPPIPNLVELTVPDYTFTPVPPFTGHAPEFAAGLNVPAVDWAPSAHVTTILNEEMSVLRRMWQGGTGLPPAVEQALWERAASREDAAIARDISAASTEFSGRGFTLPPGMLVNRIDAIRTEGQLKKQALGREILIKVADTHIENLRFACQQALAAEGVLAQLWHQMGQFQLEIQKTNVEGEIAFMNAQINLFNARQSAYATAAQVHKTEIEARAAEVAVFKAQIEAEIAKGQINEQRMKLFVAMYEGVKADAEVYKAEVQGAMAAAEMQRSTVEVYKAQVQASLEALQRDKLVFEGYEAQIKGEAAKAAMFEANARGYAAYVSGVEANARVAVQQHQGALASFEAGLKAFLGNLEVEKLGIQSQTAVIQAQADAIRAEAARDTSKAQIETTWAEIELKEGETALRLALAAYDVELRKYLETKDQAIRQTTLRVEGLKSIAQMNSTLAAGAMAGISLGSSIGADAKISASGNDNYSTTISMPAPGSTTN